MIKRHVLEKLYIDDRLSMMEISVILNCSQNKVVYWMTQYDIKRRTISDAIYHQHNPSGDPFKIATIDTVSKAELFGMGIGLYWGEGNKANKYAIRLGNTDPDLLNTFIRFLVEIFNVKKDDMKFSLQIFTDIDPDTSLDYWIMTLQVQKSQFYKTHVTISGSIGTYRNKSKYGVVTVYYHNKRLRDILVGMLPR